MNKPVIAAVNGAAVGVGLVMALYSDYRICSAEAKLGTAFARRGLVAEYGLAWLLPRVVGMARAMEMALTCRMLDAAEAKNWGLVTHVTEPDALIDRAMTMAHEIAALPPRSIRLNKRLMRQAQSMTLDGALELSAAFQAIVQNTADQREAVAAMLEKRTPEFTGA